MDKDNNMLKLSVITTLYNSAGYMRKCIDSLLDQDLAPGEYEIILVNDGSPDDSLSIANGYAEKFGNVSVVSYAENRGLAGARQAGTDAAQGKYLCYVDPDDYVLPNSFSQLIERMERDSLDVLRFDYRMVDGNYSPVPKPKDARIIDYSAGVMNGRDFLCRRLGYACFVWAFIYRTSVIRDSGVLFSQGDYFDDTAWLPRILCAAGRVDCTDTVRYFYLQRQGSLVNTVSKEKTIAKMDAQMVLIIKLMELWNADRTIVWYREMVSKTVLSVLTDAACCCYDNCGAFIDELKDCGVFPIGGSILTFKARLKYMLINISPKLFCTLVHLANR